MEIGWIDFSKTERNKVFNVLDLLGESGVLDELGIATIRDGFSDLLFPGTSTLQTRAKYFLIVPYALKDLELNNEIKIGKLNNDFDQMEEKCSKILNNKHPGENGIIGRNAILQNSWVQRPPSSIYLAGLRKYGIFNFKSINHYMKFISAQKQEMKNKKYLGNTDEKTEGVHDDLKGLNQFSHYFDIPTYHKDWLENLDINLTPDEGQFLKNQIVTNCKESMMAYLLENEMTEILDFEYITDLNSIMFKFPEQIQKDYKIAMKFSNFVYVLRVLYNIILSDGKNIKANKEFNLLKGDLEDISNIDLTQIMVRLKINNIRLKQFLEISKKLMANGDIESLKEEIKKREIQLKGTNRAKLCHIGEFDENEWFAGNRLTYRFGNVQNILRDIFASEGVI